MSDGRLPLPSPFVPLHMSRDNSVGSHGSPNLSSHPVDHGSQVFRPFQRSSTGNGAQHSCGVPHLSLHGFGHPRSSSTVFGMSHGDHVQTIHGDQSTILPPAGHGIGKNECDGPLNAAFYRRPISARRGGNSRCRGWNSPSPPPSYPIRDHGSRDWVHAAVTKRAHLTHNGVPILSAATAAITLSARH